MSNLDNSQPKPERNKNNHMESWWHSFNKQVPNNSAGWSELFSRCQESYALECQFCQSTDLKFIPDQRKFNCKSCDKYTSMTAKGIFYRVREIRAWLATLSAFENGISLSSPKLAKLTGIAQSTALNILKKFKLVMLEELANSNTEISSALLCSLYGKRSKETPARRHPISEQEEIDKLLMKDDSADETTNITDSVCNTAETPNPIAPELSNKITKLTDEQKLVFNALSNATSMYFDEICQSTELTAAAVNAALTNLEIEDLVNRSFGDRYSINRPKQNPEIQLASNYDNRNLFEQNGETTLTVAIMKTIELIEGAIQSVHQRVSRKFIQPYVAEKIYLFAQGSPSSPTLFQACMDSNPISYEELLAYVSPPKLKLRTLAAAR